MVKYRLKLSVIVITIIFFLSAYFTITLVVENKWFESTVKIHTVLHEGDGLRRGTHVSLRGIRVGEVSEIEILDEGNLKISLKIKRSYFDKLKSNASAQVRRSLLISDKKIDIDPGSGSVPLKPDAVISGQDSRELTDLLSSGRLFPYLEKFETLAVEFTTVARRFSEEDRIVKIVEIYDQILPVLKAMRVSMTDTFPKMTNDVRVFREEFIDKGDVRDSLTQLNDLLTKINRVIQTDDVNGIREELRAVLRETAITMKAMQELWFLEGKAERARDLLLKAQEIKERVPASEQENQTIIEQDKKAP